MAKLLSCFHFKTRTLKHNEKRRGSFVTEFAILAPPFFLLMMAVIELCLMEGAQQLLESAAYNTSRLGKTGFVTEGQTQAQTINQILVRELSSYGALIDVAHVTTTQASYSSFSGAAAGGGADGYGVEDQIVTYTISYPWKIFTPLMCSAMGSACGTGNIVNLNSTIVVRNEPYG
jgi:Flp pilus assembly protein TadG